MWDVDRRKEARALRKMGASCEVEAAYNLGEYDAERGKNNVGRFPAGKRREAYKYGRRVTIEEMDAR